MKSHVCQIKIFLDSNYHPSISITRIWEFNNRTQRFYTLQGNYRLARLFKTLARQKYINLFR